MACSKVVIVLCLCGLLPLFAYAGKVANLVSDWEAKANLDNSGRLAMQKNAKRPTETISTSDHWEDGNAIEQDSQEETTKLYQEPVETKNMVDAIVEEDNTAIVSTEPSQELVDTTPESEDRWSKEEDEAAESHQEPEAITSNFSTETITEDSDLVTTELYQGSMETVAIKQNNPVEEDVTGAGTTELYKEPVETDPTTTTITTTEETSIATQKKLEVTPDLCKDSEFDVMIKLESCGKTYVFKGDYYWSIGQNEAGRFLNEPRLISENWQGLPGNLDAGFTWTDGLTYFFKGDQFWTYGMDNRIKGPMNMADKFPGVPANLDGAVYWPLTGFLYFFKDDQTIQFKYPNSYSTYSQRGTFKAVVNFGKEFHQFYKGGRFDVRDRSKVISEDKLTAVEWFGCPRSEKLTSSVGLYPGIETAPNLCQDSDFDVMVQLTSNKVVYVFKGHYYWSILEEGNRRFLTRPRLIFQNWEGMPGNLDAGFTMTNGKTYFFKGNQLWIYDAQNNISGPNKMAEIFPGIPSDLNGAAYFPLTDSVYFYKGNKTYWFRSANSYGIFHEQGTVKSIIGLAGDFYQFDQNGTYDIRYSNIYKVRGKSTAVNWFGCSG